MRCDAALDPGLPLCQPISWRQVYGYFNRRRNWIHHRGNHRHCRADLFSRQRIGRIFGRTAADRIEDHNMEKQVWAYALFGLALVVLFVIIIVHYYSKKRHSKVEEIKYKMLDDDD
jgi:cbb3-type cytochrome oxidase subunit 3